MRSCQAPNCNQHIDPLKPTNTLYCSNECAAAVVKARNLLRTCRQCNNPIPAGFPPQARVCSDACRDARRHASEKAYAERHKARIMRNQDKLRKAARAVEMQELYENRPPCDTCGGRMPHGAHALALVCGQACRLEKQLRKERAERAARSGRRAARGGPARKAKPKVRAARKARAVMPKPTPPKPKVAGPSYSSFDHNKPQRDHSADIRFDPKPTFVRMPTVELQIARAMTLFTDFGEAMQGANQPPPEAPRQVQRPHLRN